jgi:hypothetical protein
MRIPPDALIPAGKLTNYLLVRKAQNDKSRYLARGGFGLDNPAALNAAIRQLTSEVDAVADRVNEHGTYYTIRGLLAGPAGLTLPVRLVWLLRLDGVFSFVTLVPEKETSP